MDRATIAGAVGTRLNAKCGKPDLASVVDFVKTGRTVLLDLVRELVLARLATLPGCHVPANSHFPETDSGDMLFVNVETRILTRTVEVEILFFGRDVDPEALQVSYGAAIRNAGPLANVSVILPAAIASYEEPILTLAATVLDVGLAWIETSLLDAMGDAEVAIVEALYSLVRRIMPEPSLHRYVWFATVGPLYGFRFVSRPVTEQALEKLKSFVNGKTIDPLDLLAALLASRRPKGGLLMTKAIAEGRCIEVDVADADYAHDGNYYAYVLTALYGGTAFTIYPVHSIGEFHVVALFPVGRHDIADRLTHEIAELRDVSTRLGRQISEAVALFDQDPASPWTAKSSAPEIPFTEALRDALKTPQRRLSIFKKSQPPK
jgi:hypothetical protein